MNARSVGNQRLYMVWEKKGLDLGSRVKKWNDFNRKHILNQGKR